MPVWSEGRYPDSVTEAKPRTYAGRSIDARRSDRRERFLQAGIAVFGEVGYNASSVSALCREAGLARSQFYENFDNREILLREVYDLIQVEAREAIIAALQEAGDAGIQERMRAAITAFAESVGSDPRRAAVSFVEIAGVSPEIEENRFRQRKVWNLFLEAEFRREFGDRYEPPGGYDNAATGFVGALTALVHSWSLSRPQPDLSGLVESATRFLLAMAPPL